jgi:hypothetical protein
MKRINKTIHFQIKIKKILIKIKVKMKPKNPKRIEIKKTVKNESN